MPGQHDKRGVSVVGVRAEHHDCPLGIGETRPRLSWFAKTDVPGWQQAGYEVEITSAERTSTWRVESAESVLVAWPDSPLQSREKRDIRVRVWGAGDAAASSWSEPLRIEAGLVDPSEWTACMVSPGPGEPTRPFLLRKDFPVEGNVAEARLYVTAHGVYEAEINGIRVGDHILAPGWTSYAHRLRYQTFDVTNLLCRGENAIGALLGDGWYRGRLGFEGGERDIYGDETALLAQLEMRFDDGRVRIVGTDETWRAKHGPITASGLYEGERYDARGERNGWSSPGFDDSAWSVVHTVPRDPVTLVAPTGPPVRCVEEVEPVGIWTSPSGRTIVDFGQNLVGRLRIAPRGPRGNEITLRHAEVLQEGELYVRPLRTAEATDRYVLRGDAEGEIWEPRFTYHGFRYAEVTGWPGEITAGDIVARVCHTDMRRTGWFSCSDPLLNRLHENVLWSMRGNFFDIPTDCPQRDERLGWTGDIQVFGPTASFLYDCAGMLSSWLTDVACDQDDQGVVPFIVPSIPVPFWNPTWAAAVWGDVAVLTPWTLYERFGDVDILRRQYASARAWVDRAASEAGDRYLWQRGKQLGDWLDPTAPPDDPFAAKTDAYLVATAYLALSSRTLSRIARVLEEDTDAEKYSELSEKVVEAFNREYVLPDGRLTSDAQAAYALALRFGLIPDPGKRAGAGRRLVELVRANEHRIGTGFAGTPIICDALTGTDAVDTAYSLVAQRECPSWLYPVLHGATTIWERWDSLLPDGTVNPGEMTSFNHYALGAVADWLHRTVAGLSPAAPGYRRLLIAPRPGGGLTSAEATHDTPYGRAEVRWNRTGGELTVTVTVPAGSTAELDLPGLARTEITAGTHEFTVPYRAASEDPVH